MADIRVPPSKRTSPIGACGAREPCETTPTAIFTFSAAPSSVLRSVSCSSSARIQTGTTGRVEDIAVDSRIITLFRRKSKTHGLDELVLALQMSWSVHPEIADLLQHAFVIRYRAAELPAATHFWRLPGDQPGSPSSDMVTH